MEFQPDWIKIVDFLLKAKFWASPLFFLSPSICVNVRDHVCLRVCLHVCLCAIFSRAAWGMETWIVPCCHKLSGACFKPISFTKSSQKSSKKAKTSSAPCSTAQAKGLTLCAHWIICQMDVPRNHGQYARKNLTNSQGNLFFSKLRKC